MTGIYIFLLAMWFISALRKHFEKRMGNEHGELVAVGMMALFGTLMFMVAIFK